MKYGYSGIQKVNDLAVQGGHNVTMKDLGCKKTSEDYL